ncbi:MAG TPA: hypothetical protein VGO57_04655 [Verrucomicrobiae bacterium]
MKRGIKTIIGGAGLFLFGAFVVPLLFILPLILGKSDETQFKVPGTREVTVKKPGRYYLWNDYQVVFDGKSYDRSKNIPDGMEIHVQDVSGAPLTLISSTSITISDNGSAQNSIGYVEIKNAGPVKITVTGGGEDRIFSFKPSAMLKVFSLILGGLGVAGLVTIAGLATIIWGVVKLLRSNRTKMPA